MGIKASHNTMTYRKPKQWWLRPFAWIARCQSRSYQEQNADAWDLRIYWDKDGYPEFRHGLFAYEGRDIYDVLAYANRKKKRVRLMLENRSFLNKDVEKRHLCEKFVELCKDVEKRFTDIKFFGGRDLLTWEVLHDFGYQPSTADFYSSQDGGEWYRKLNDLWPWLWSWRNNKKMLEKLNDYSDDIIVFYDFI